MIPQKTAVGSGLTLSTINTDKFKTGVLMLSLCLPLCARDHLLASVLAGVMHRGTEKYPSMAQINRRLDMLYAANVDIQTVIRGNFMCFTLSAEMLEQRFSLDGTDITDGVMEAMAEILFRPIKNDGLLPEDTVGAERGFVRDALAAASNDTAAYASTRLKELLYRDQGVVFPTVEYMLSEVDSVTPRELSDFHTRLCQGAARIFYVGGESHERIAELTSRHFAPLSGNAGVLCSLPVPHIALPLCDVCEDRPVNQGKLSVGMRTGVTMGDSRTPAAIVLNSVFGGSSASKLFLGVRERLGLCYYCSSSYGSMSGNITVHSGIDTANKDVTFDAVMSAFEEIKRGEVSDFELSAAKKYLTHSYTQIYDSPAELAAFYSLRDLFGVRETVEGCIRAIDGVSAEDICALSRDTKYDTRFFLNGTAGETSEAEND